MQHTLNYSESTRTGLCSCRLVLMANCTQPEAERLHAHHVASETIRPTAQARVWLAQMGRSAWSGFYKSEV
jgi:hypothetical protein